MDCMQWLGEWGERTLWHVSIPQAVWIACNGRTARYVTAPTSFNTASGMDCMQWLWYSQVAWCRRSFNTASGMDCMQFIVSRLVASAAPEFQYRKRYGLHAMHNVCKHFIHYIGFNTASGMDCMQSYCPYCKKYERGFNTASGMDCMQSWRERTSGRSEGSFNTASGMDCMQSGIAYLLFALSSFQYRKRYGLHAIPST